MPKEKKDMEIHARITKDLKEWMEEYRHRQGMTQSGMVYRALSEMRDRLAATSSPRA